jgi:hypothetical protein
MESGRLSGGERGEIHPLPPFAGTLLPPFAPKVRGVADFLADFLAGEFNLPFHPRAFVDSRGCLPKTNWLPWNPCLHAHGARPERRVPNPGTPSTSATWCSSGQGRIPTGKQACSWSARCAMMAASQVLCCDRTALDTPRLGTRTARPKCCASAEPRFRPQKGRSIAPATLRIALDAWEGTAGSEHLIRYQQLNAGRIRPPPTFEFYSILPTLLGSWTGSD